MDEGMDESKAKDELDEITGELVRKLHDSRARWTELYQLIHRVEETSLWRAGGFRSLTKWIEDLSRRAKVQVQYLWRVKKAGRFYADFERAEAAAGREVTPLSDVALGDEMLADIDRISEGRPERAAEYVRAALAGDLTKREVKSMARATAGKRAQARRAKSGDGEQTAQYGVTASDIVLELRPEVFYTPAQLSAHLLHGARRVWGVLTEFPVLTGTSDRARRIDALCVSNAADSDQYSVLLDMVEIKVSDSDLERDTKHLEYEGFCDRCWFAVPEPMRDRAVELAPEGWGVLAYDPESRALSQAAGAEVRPGVMRAHALATALVKVLPSI